MLSYNRDKLLEEVGTIIISNSIKVSIMGHFIEKIEDRKLVDFLNYDRTLCKDYIDNGPITLTLAYETADDFRILHEKRLKIEELLKHEGYSVKEVHITHDPSNVGIRGSFNFTFVINDLR